MGPGGGARPLGSISKTWRRPSLAATLAAEDHRFHEHDGIDWRALGPARRGSTCASAEVAFGGSTITMQLARLVTGVPRTGAGKVQQAFLAARLERALSKKDILTHYLNRVYYGNGAWGAEAAALRYFDKPARNLGPGEAAFLAVLPRGPERYDPFAHRARAIERRGHILRLLEERGAWTATEVAMARNTPLSIQSVRPPFRAPHFAEHVVADIASPHGVVPTTLDGPLQHRVEIATGEHLKKVHRLGIDQAAVVVLRHEDGAILAMVGSEATRGRAQRRVQLRHRKAAPGGPR